MLRATAADLADLLAKVAGIALGSASGERERAGPVRRRNRAASRARPRETYS
jgi:hypothetical protein